jgi:hypothetical protein
VLKRLARNIAATGGWTRDADRAVARAVRSKLLFSIVDEVEVPVLWCRQLINLSVTSPEISLKNQPRNSDYSFASEIDHLHPTVT